MSDQPKDKKKASTNAEIAKLGSTLDQYMAEVNRFPLLSRDQEQELAKAFVETEDVDAAQRLVTSNLRFVVKVAYEYRNYDVKLVDLIQEGNIGLMKAVRRFNPDRGYRLISYAVWWIRAYMQNYIIKSWSMVKIGPTAKQRKMLFGKRQPFTEDQDQQEMFLLPAMNAFSTDEMPTIQADVARRDFYLDADLSTDGGGTYMEMLRDSTDDQEEALGRAETADIVSSRLKEVIDSLNEREQFILNNRILADEPMTLQEIGDHYGISRERARQLEQNLKKKLAKLITDFDKDSAEVVDL